MPWQSLDSLLFISVGSVFPLVKLPFTTLKKAIVLTRKDYAVETTSSWELIIGWSIPGLRAEPKGRSEEAMVLMNHVFQQVEGS